MYLHYKIQWHKIQEFRTVFIPTCTTHGLELVISKFLSLGRLVDDCSPPFKNYFNRHFLVDVFLFFGHKICNSNGIVNHEVDLLLYWKNFLKGFKIYKTLCERLLAAWGYWNEANIFILLESMLVWTTVEQFLGMIICIKGRRKNVQIEGSLRISLTKLKIMNTIEQFCRLFMLPAFHVYSHIITFGQSSMVHGETNSNDVL